MRGRVLVVHLLMLALPLTLNAQRRSVGVGCDRGHHWTARCNGDSDCDAVLARHNCDAHDECGSSSGSSSSSTAVLSLRDTPSRVVMKSAIVGGALGAMLGSFKLNADSGAMAGAGAAIGAGGMMAVAVVGNRGDWSRTGATVVGAIAGAAIGGGAGLMADGKYEKGSPEDLAHTDQAGTMAGAGAVAGAALGFALSTLSTGQFVATPGVRRFAQRVRVINTGRRVGLTVSW